MVTFDAHSPLPLYEQLYRFLSDEIRTGERPAGSRLPGKRSMAGQLGISVNTVDTAYQILAAEGLVESRPRSGFVVLEYDAPVPAPAQQALPKPGAPEPSAHFAFDLTTGGVDTALFPFRQWGRIQKELLYNQPELLRHGHPLGDESLRAAIAGHLRQYRGVACTADQIVVGAGTEYLLGQLAHLFAGKTAAVENPGYRRTSAILQVEGVSGCPVPIDEGGLSLAGLRASGAQLCYVTPSHHFPTGVTMPAPRRAQLIRWAQEQPGRYILEDDYDSEFRYDIRPLPSLQGMAGPEGPVVYLTTFTQSLAPSIRIACMVLPPPLMEAYRALYAAYSCPVSRFDQQALCRFITEGHFARHLARMRLAYKTRMEMLAAALEAAFGRENIRLQGRHTGLHLLLTLPGGPGESAMVQRAAKAGVRLRGLGSYYMAEEASCPPNTVVVGYSGLDTAQIPELVRRLHEAWRAQ